MPQPLDFLSELFAAHLEKTMKWEKTMERAGLALKPAQVKPQKEAFSLGRVTLLGSSIPGNGYKISSH